MTPGQVLAYVSLDFNMIRKPDSYIDLLSLPGFLESLRRQHKRVLAAFGVLAALTVLYTANRQREYESSAKLFVRIGRETVSVDPTAAASGQTIGVTDTQEREIRSIVSLLSNRDLLEQVVDELGPQTILDYSDGNIPKGESLVKKSIGAVRASLKSAFVACGLFEEVSDREKAIQRVGESLKIEAGDSSAVIKLSVRADSPKLAQLIVAKLVDLHLSYHVQANSTPGSLPFFSAQTKRLRGEIKIASEQLAALKNKNGLASLDEKKASLETQMQSLNEKLSQANADLASASSTVATLQEQLAGESEMVPSAETVGMANSTKATMRQELYRLQILESELLAKLKDTHPKVAEIRDQIEQARSVFDQEEQQVQTTNSTNAVYQQLRISLLVELGNRAALEARIKALESEREKLKQEISRVNDGEVLLVNLQREVDLLDVNYRHYVENLEQARIQRELESQQISNVNVIQKPSFVDFPTGPGNLLILTLGLMASCSLACGFGVFWEFLDPQDVVVRRFSTIYTPEISSVKQVREPMEV